MATPQFTCYQVQEPRAEYGTFQRVKTVKVKTRYYPNQQVPMIVLSGQWLEQAGFTIGTTIEVQAFQNGIKLCIEQQVTPTRTSYQYARTPDAASLLKNFPLGNCDFP